MEGEYGRYLQTFRPLESDFKQRLHCHLVSPYPSQLSRVYQSDHEGSLGFASMAERGCRCLCGSGFRRPIHTGRMMSEAFCKKVLVFRSVFGYQFSINYQLAVFKVRFSFTS